MNLPFKGNGNPYGRFAAIMHMATPTFGTLNDSEAGVGAKITAGIVTVLLALTLLASLTFLGWLVLFVRG